MDSGGSGLVASLSIFDSLPGVAPLREAFEQTATRYSRNRFLTEITKSRIWDAGKLNYLAGKLRPMRRRLHHSFLAELSYTLQD